MLYIKFVQVEFKVLFCPQGGSNLEPCYIQKVEYDKRESVIYTQERMNCVTFSEVFFKSKEETASR